MEYRMELVTFRPRICSLRPSLERLVAEWIVGAPRFCMPPKPMWVNLLYGCIKSNVCLGSEYGISDWVGHIFTTAMFPTP